MSIFLLINFFGDKRPIKPTPNALRTRKHTHHGGRWGPLYTQNTAMERVTSTGHHHKQPLDPPNQGQLQRHLLGDVNHLNIRFLHWFMVILLIKLLTLILYSVSECGNLSNVCEVHKRDLRSMPIVIGVQGKLRLIIRYFS